MPATWKKYGWAVAAIFLLAAAQVHASSNNPLVGEKLYKESCMACHTEEPAGMMGASTALLVERMHTVKAMKAPEGKVAHMQKVLKRISDQEITAIAVYLNGMR
ncbi:c-type cytochrome [Desulfovibrio sp. ZJ369]|uniref:c-type cytochrome n=1 Tax=Desulfovibrio sp. ZJ369 TaxID=2709793 RepID=UPI0013ECAF01|nr:c-type cytochrome [Desulfovibrio sp. ZJ369]